MQWARELIKFLRSKEIKLVYNMSRNLELIKMCYILMKISVFFVRRTYIFFGEFDDDNIALEQQWGYQCICVHICIVQVSQSYL